MPRTRCFSKQSGSMLMLNRLLRATPALKRRCKPLRNSLRRPGCHPLVRLSAQGMVFSAIGLAMYRSLQRFGGHMLKDSNKRLLLMDYCLMRESLRIRHVSSACPELSIKKQIPPSLHRFSASGKMLNLPASFHNYPFFHLKGPLRRPQPTPTETFTWGQLKHLLTSIPIATDYPTEYVSPRARAVKRSELASMSFQTISRRTGFFGTIRSCGCTPQAMEKIMDSKKSNVGQQRIQPMAQVKLVRIGGESYIPVRLRAQEQVRWSKQDELHLVIPLGCPIVRPRALPSSKRSWRHP